MSADILATLDPDDTPERDGTARYVYLHPADGGAMPPELRSWLKDHGGWFMSKRRPPGWRLPSGQLADFRPVAAEHGHNVTRPRPQARPSRRWLECPDCTAPRMAGTGPCTCGSDRMPVEQPADPDPAELTTPRLPLRELAALLPDVATDDAPAARSPSTEP